MSVRKIELLDEDRFPRMVRKAINVCIRRLNREWIFVLADDFTITQSKTDESEEQVKVTLPRSRSSGGPPNTPLKLIAANDGAAKGNVVYGTVKGMDVTPAATAVSDGDHAWVQINVTYDSAGGFWNYNSVSLHFGATVPTPDATHMYLNAGNFSVSGAIATPHPALTGSQDALRCGNSSTFSDSYGVQ